MRVTWVGHATLLVQVRDTDQCVPTSPPSSFGFCWNGHCCCSMHLHTTFARSRVMFRHMSSELCVH